MGFWEEVGKDSSRLPKWSKVVPAVRQLVNYRADRALSATLTNFDVVGGLNQEPESEM